MYICIYISVYKYSEYKEILLITWVTTESGISLNSLITGLLSIPTVPNMPGPNVITLPSAVKQTV